MGEPGERRNVELPLGIPEIESGTEGSDSMESKVPGLPEARPIR